jgi:hypothetical protein
MFAKRKESFYDLSNYPNDSTSTQTKKIQEYYGTTLPNIRFNNDPSMSYIPLTRTVNTRTRSSETVMNDKWNKVVEGYQSGNSLSDNQAVCESTGNGDQFEHLTSLESTQDPNSQLRCGWVYNSSNPMASRGAFGSSAGAFNTQAQGTWMWDLRNAKQTMHTAICDSIQSCQDIDASIYKQRCGWCATSGKAVPIAQGSVAYPNSINSCSQSDLVTSGASCPAPQPITDPTYIRTPAEACTPLSNGALPRNCLLQKTIVAGCSDQGSLYQALRSGSDSNYTNILTQLPVYNQYQSRSQTPLNITSLKTGKLTVSDAINEFSRISDNSMSPANDSLRASARDLCYTKGYYDSYDVCSELQDTATGPYSLECLQKAFLRAGGQKDGAMYPSPANIGFWNKYPTWRAVKSAIQEMGGSTNSSNRVTQETALMDYYGIKIENKRTPDYTLPTPPICYYGNYYKRLGSFKIGYANDRPDYVMNNEPYRSSDGWILVTSNDWSKIGFRNETFSDIFMTRKDINGIDIVNVLKPIAQQNSIGDNPRNGNTFNFLIKNQNNTSSVLIMKSSALFDGSYGGTGRLTFAHGEYKGNNNPEQLNVVNQLQQINGVPSINGDVYELYYAVSSDTCPRKPIIRNPICYLGYNFRKIGEFKLGIINDRADYMMGKDPYRNSDGWIFVTPQGVNDWMVIGQRNETTSAVWMTGVDINGSDIRTIMTPIAQKNNISSGNIPYGSSGPWFNYYIKSKSSSSSVVLMKCGAPITGNYGGTSRISGLIGEYTGNNYPNQSLVTNQQAYPVGTPKINSDIYELYYVLNTDTC